MAIVTIRGEQEERLTDAEAISAFLSQYGIWYRRFEGDDALSEDASEEAILEAYAEPIRKLKEEGGYVTADVINIKPDIPNLDAMLSKFSKEHWHNEDEVRFIVKGSGLFHINPPNDDPVFSIEVVKGDMINVPEGTHHWFDMCADKTIRAIRLFQDVSGWTPHYTDSGEDDKHTPMCFGYQHIPPSDAQA